MALVGMVILFVGWDGPLLAVAEIVAGLDDGLVERVLLGMKRVW